ncbi:MAG: YdeI/OmpD-associated family protein [Bacteroidota bacterium]
MQYAKSIEEFFANSGKWHEALRLLQQTLHATNLQETLKWGIPVYTLNKKNVVGIAGFKSFVALWFYQGALLDDPAQQLINAQKGKTQALRQWRFESLEEIQLHLPMIEKYVKEAIQNQEQGREIKPQKNKPLDIPPELLERLSADTQLKSQFETLSLGRRRDYAEYISEAKREQTKQKRLEKIIPMILEGVGLNDRYMK